MDIKAVSQLMAAFGTRRFLSQKAERNHRTFRPTGKALRDPKDPIRVARIVAAKCKRARKASVAQRNYNRCIAGGI